ncbi:MAG: uroporphyrinogen-III C-methyltransferase [Gammaproteobacteria bacterium]|nr:uroporphyrinogen-III C-methyltransferase [Gammaproteobacteria bacterium]
MTEAGSKPTFEVLSVETNPPARRVSRLPAALALLLAGAALGVSAWHWFAMREVRAELEDVRASTNELAARAGRGPDPRLAEALRGLEQGEARMTGLDLRIDALGTDTAALRERLAAITVADRRDWALAEAEYLERLASQSLLMGREVRGALALLGAADGILRDLDDPALHASRAALATDIASLRAVAEFDVEGLYLRLAALVEQVPALALMERSRAEAFGGDAAAEPAGAGSWWSRLTAVLGRYVVVRQRNESIKPLLPLAEEGYLRMNLRLGLEQAKLALLAAEPAIYRRRCRVQQFAGTYLSPTVVANRAFLDEVTALAAMDVAPALPDISGSLRALRERSGASTPVAPALAPAPAPADATIGEQ